MNRPRFSIFALFVFALTMLLFVSCDDGTRSNDDVTTPPSDFEWTTSWTDVQPKGRPMVGSESILVPTLGAFDVVKVDTLGQELWRQSFAERHFCTTINLGSGYLAAGELDNETIVRFMSNNGEPMWLVTLDSLYWLSAIVQTQTNLAFVFGGMISESGPQIGIAKVSVSGELEGYTSFEGTNISRDVFDGAIRTNDGGALAYGYTFPEGEAEDKAGLIMRLNPGGTIRWSRVYSPSAWDEIRDAVELPSGDFLCVGETQPNGRDSRAWVLRITADGEIDWQHSPNIGGAWDKASGVVIDDSVAIVAGSSLPDSGVELFGWLCSYTLSGEHEATRTLRGRALALSVPPIAISNFGDLYLLGYSASSNPSFSLSQLRQPLFPNP